MDTQFELCTECHGHGTCLVGSYPPVLERCAACFGTGIQDGRVILVRHTLQHEAISYFLKMHISQRMQYVSLEIVRDSITLAVDIGSVSKNDLEHVRAQIKLADTYSTIEIHIPLEFIFHRWRSMKQIAERLITPKLEYLHTSHANTVQHDQITRGIHRAIVTKKQGEEPRYTSNHHPCRDCESLLEHLNHGKTTL